MTNNKKYSFLLIILAIALLLPFGKLSASANESGVTQVTAVTGAEIKQGEMGTCYVYIDSLERLSSLMVTVHYDPNKVIVDEGSVLNVAPCLLYDKTVQNAGVQVSYIFDGAGQAVKVPIFYFNYTVLGQAEEVDSYFDIVVSEAYDSSLIAMPVVGSRCEFKITPIQQIHVHNFTRIVLTDFYKKSSATCTEKAVYYYCCATCDTRGINTFEFGETLEHNYNANWLKDTEKHWLQCTGCSARKEEAAHVMSAGKCSVCGYESVSSTPGTTTPGTTVPGTVIPDTDSPSVDVPNTEETDTVVADKAVTAGTQKELEKVLKDPEVAQITIKAKKGKTLTIPEGDYSRISLEINGAKVKVNNYGTFKKVVIRDALKYMEMASGNTIKVIDKKLTLGVEKGAEVKSLSLSKKDSINTVVIRGKVKKLTVTKAATVKLTVHGTLDKFNVENTTDIVIKGNTREKILVHANADVKLKNNTTKTIQITEVDGTIKKVAPNKTVNTRD